MNSLIGKVIYEARLRAGLKQSELEKMSGLPKLRLSKIEAGKANISIKTLEKIFDVLKIKIEFVQVDKVGS